MLLRMADGSSLVVVGRGGDFDGFDFRGVGHGGGGVGGVGRVGRRYGFSGGFGDAAVIRWVGSSGGGGGVGVGTGWGCRHCTCRCRHVSVGERK